MGVGAWGVVAIGVFNLFCFLWYLLYYTYGTHAKLDLLYL